MAGRKLTPDQVEELKELKIQTEEQGQRFFYSKIAKKYGVSGQTIRRHIAPTESDKKPRPAPPYDPVAVKKRRAASRTYNITAYRHSEADNLIIKHLDAVPNKQQYIKDLILKDILSGEK